MLKPILFTMVKAVPRAWDELFCATRVENRGESATTTIPHKRRKQISKISESWKNITGEIKQHNPERKSAPAAVFFTPANSEI